MLEKPNQGIFEPIHIFISPNDKIEVQLNSEDIENCVVKGASLNDEYQSYINNVENYVDERAMLLIGCYEEAMEINDTLKMRQLEIEADIIYAELEEIRKQKAYDYIKSNPTSFISAYSLYNFRNTFDDKQTEELLNLLDKKLYDSIYILKIINSANNLPGKKADDFTLKDSNNNTVVFSSFCKDKVVLIEFWASWCSICRKTNPKLEAIYQLYKDKGFEILGISQDRDLTILQNTIVKDQITWTNLLDIKGTASIKDKYNISALPANILIDKYGTVIARDISLEDIESEIIKLLK